ncbi:hypothetical protein [Streptomyces sp. CA-179760]|uniref:hypothetical protein n=1 Tax=Streptomyces sp. CA-179760 TaxID=3240054 RepID=UPI003D8B3F10
MPPGQSKVELYAALPRDSRDGMSNRALQCKYGVTWSTVNKALTSAWPQPRTTTASARPSKLDPFTLLIDEILLIDLDATRKQRHTVTPDLPPSDRRALLVRGVALTT